MTLKFLIFSTLFIGCTLWAGEESLDLSNLPEQSKLPLLSAQQPRWNLMGRIDLTSETSSPEKGKTSEHELSNRHFLVMLQAKASERTSFMGELVNSSFYFVDFNIRKNLNFQFGKIVVPFGDTRKFHHFYGGLSQLKDSSIMFPNVWAESGVNFNYKVSESDSFDLYWVNSIQSSSDTADPDLKSSVSTRSLQAGGARWTGEFGLWTTILSAYRGEFQPGREVFIAGGDLYSNYGIFNLKDLRVSMGIANAWFKKGPVTGNFQQRGDYLELAKRQIGTDTDELRFRYGTFIYNSERKSQKDTHSFSVGYAFLVDVMKMVFEYQWNYEEVTEKDNDIAKAMVSVDF